jgi:hypothetical protein
MRGVKVSISSVCTHAARCSQRQRSQNSMMTLGDGPAGVKGAVKGYAGRPGGAAGAADDAVSSGQVAQSMAVAESGDEGREEGARLLAARRSSVWRG